jgi:hypothetical protein
MSNTQAMCTSFLGEVLTATHNFGVAPTRGTTAADTFKAALYTATSNTGTSSTVCASVTTYSATVNTVPEVSGTGYTAGGVAVTNTNVPLSSNTSVTAGTAYWTPSASITYTTVTLATAFDTVLIYNSTQSNKAVSVHTFGSQTITAGTFTLTMPANTTAAALLRIATT